MLSKKANKLLLLFKEINTVFYSEYKAARIIIDMGMCHKAKLEDDEGYYVYSVVGIHAGTS